ncbi:MAG: acetyl-CoA carboxylase carboxyltransferase subunit alpha [Lentisphaerae bacterium]|nr:acetyl-CoA carboxylase carboxyltransferase subunit alpha [Lentisphaerota bacterium]
MSQYSLSFEKPIVELQKRLTDLEEFSRTQQIDVTESLQELEKKLEETRLNIYNNLSPWDKVQLASHPARPYTLDYINELFTDFVELHGDRRFSDDGAIITGFAKLDGHRVAVVGTQKGRDVKTNIIRNFGMAQPEGYRKALRVMQLASRFGLPVITFIDTAGAYPGVGSEERHIAEAIAVNLREMMLIETPIIVTVIGEGGSGGALGIGVGNRIIILEHSYYSVISPEGCAAILWKDRAHAPRAAEAHKLTAKDLLGFGLIDEIVPEPLGGAHTEQATRAANLKKTLLKHLRELQKLTPSELM